MNRIYQGSTTALEFISTGREPKVTRSFDFTHLRDQTNPLWEHHSNFQDAINYFLVALAAMARGTDGSGDSEYERLAHDLLARVTESWEKFPRREGGRSLRDSLRPWLSLAENATLDDAFDAILAGNDADSRTRFLALQLVLDRCAGDSGIQQGGRGYLPKLVVGENEDGKPYSGTFEFDEGTIAAAAGKDRLADLIHSEASGKELATFAAEMEISWAGIKCKPDETISGDELRKRLGDGIDHQLRRFGSPTTNAESELVSRFPKIGEHLASLRARVLEIADGVALRVNKGGNISWDLVHGAYLFKVFPSPETAGILALSVKKPKGQQSSKSGPDYGRLGDDPVKLARGSREFVFPAFSALPSWVGNSERLGKPSWKEFDLAAFKEALKSLNQFNQKTAERQETVDGLYGKISILIGGGKPDGWKPTKTETGEEGVVPEPLDPELLELAWQLEERLTKELAETMVGEEKRKAFGSATYQAQEGRWRISTAALRGFRDVADRWNQLSEKRGEQLSAAELEQIVKAYQRDEKNKKEVGSVPLMLALCDPAYWPLWRKERDPKPEDEPSFNRFLYRVVSLHGDFRDWERGNQPINLTPAEPRFSRRLYMFSDIAGKEKAVLKTDADGEKSWVETTLALRESDGGPVQKQRVRIHYSAPRLRRDELLGGGESRWLQPMMRALGLEGPELGKGFDSAVSLMPDEMRKADGNADWRFLLNFPVKIDESWLRSAIGKAGIWDGQFNGVRGKAIHALWPGAGETKAYNTSPWQQNRKLVENGFRFLSVDLGQRAAGAWAIIHVATKQPSKSENKPCRSVGAIDGTEWFAIVERTGMFRLPGEEMKLWRPDIDKTTRKLIAGSKVHARELAGKAGRNSTEREYVAALDIAKRLNSEEPEKAVGSKFSEKSVAEQNDQLIRLANRSLSRLATFHRWSCFAAALAEDGRDERVKARMVAALFAELDHWQEPNVAAQREALRSENAYLADLFPRVETEEGDGTATKRGKKTPSATVGEWGEEKWTQWRESLSADNFSAFSDWASSAFEGFRETLEKTFLEIADRTVPMRGKRWSWKRRGENSRGVSYGYLEVVTDPNRPVPKIRGQRGLSMARLEQVESLRVLFLRYNRSLEKKPGEPSQAGLGRSYEAGEPAQDLLDKLDRMKEERINQTAHLILAQALGLRLKEPEGKAKNDPADRHGEYEPIPGREPVDFVVIENLDRYLTSQGRAPSENRRLMKWAHRAVRDKLKMLCEEPFGIPVVEAPAAYSSRFCAKTGEPGSRCEEMHTLSKFDRERLEKRSTEKPPAPKKDNRGFFGDLLDQFDRLHEINQARIARKEKPLTLLFPRPGGPLFLAAKSSGPVQADANAAANIGLRAIAAPDALHLLHKVRTKRKKDVFELVLGNKREKAAFEKSKQPLAFEKGPCPKLNQASSPNFFAVPDFVRGEYYDRAFVGTAYAGAAPKTVGLVSGIALHTVTDDLVFARIVEINNARLDKAEKLEP